MKIDGKCCSAKEVYDLLTADASLVDKLEATAEEREHLVTYGALRAHHDYLRDLEVTRRGNVLRGAQMKTDNTSSCVDHWHCDLLKASHLGNRPDRQAPCPTCGEAPEIRPGDNVKIGDFLYAVGPGHHAPQGPMDLRIYSAPVVDVRLDGSYSARCTSADLAGAVFELELSG